jgi:hypothetical protein
MPKELNPHGRIARRMWCYQEAEGGDDNDAEHNKDKPPDGGRLVLFANFRVHIIAGGLRLDHRDTSSDPNCTNRFTYLNVPTRHLKATTSTQNSTELRASKLVRHPSWRWWQGGRFLVSKVK